MVSTVRDLIVNALQDCGAFGRGMPPPSDAVSGGLAQLNWMLALWARKRWVVYRLQELSIACTGAAYYTIGPAGQLAMASRPAYLSYAFQRQLVSGPANPVDYPLTVTRDREDYAQLRLKSLANFGRLVYYDPEIPLGKIYPWPVIPAPYVLFVGCPMALVSYATLDDALTLPPEYEGTIYYNLVVRFGAKYRIAQDGVFVGLAKDGLNTLRQANSALKNLDMPPVLSRAGGKYNIYSDDN